MSRCYEPDRSDPATAARLDRMLQCALLMKAEGAFASDEACEEFLKRHPQYDSKRASKKQECLKKRGCPKKRGRPKKQHTLPVKQRRTKKGRVNAEYVFQQDIVVPYFKKHEYEIVEFEAPSKSVFHQRADINVRKNETLYIVEVKAKADTGALYSGIGQLQMHKYAHRHSTQKFMYLLVVPRGTVRNKATLTKFSVYAENVLGITILQLAKDDI